MAAAIWIAAGVLVLVFLWRVASALGMLIFGLATVIMSCVAIDTLLRSESAGLGLRSLIVESCVASACALMTWLCITRVWPKEE